MNQSAESIPADLDAWLQRFLQEDLGPGDITTQTLVPAATRGSVEIIAKQAGVLSGVEVAGRVLALLDPQAKWQSVVLDGQPVATGQVVVRAAATAHALLQAERTLLNLMQRMSGIATLTAEFVAAVAGTPARILETRKTAPGLRWFDKRAVVHGGGENHRMGLYDQILIKENHIAMVTAEAGGHGRPVAEAVRQSRAAMGTGVVEVEVVTIEEAREAARAGADIILLDNFSAAQVQQTVRELAEFSQVQLEASGGIHRGNVAEYAAAGVQRISIGALTHSAPALDLSMLLELGEPV